MMFRFGAIAVVAAIIAGVVPAAVSPARAAAPLNITFGGLPNGATPLKVTSNGNTATFDSTSGPGTFSVGSTAGLFTGFSTGLGDYGSFFGDPLTISFSSPLTTPLSLVFGIEDAFGLSGSDFLTVTTNLGFSQNFSGALDNLAFAEPEGTAVINNPGLTSLTITSANPFAIGSLTAVPEPFTLSILAAGLVGIAAVRRRHS